MRLDVESTSATRPTVESAAWFVIAEGVTNAVKHAGVDARGHRGVRRAADQLRRRPSPTPASGGADPRGRGLQGLADRVAALGGAPVRRSPTGRGGTRLEAVFPCGS